MSMVELAHNSCYVDSKGNAREKREGKGDGCSRFNHHAARQQKEGGGGGKEGEEEILDNLTIDPFSDVRGLIAMFYRNMWAMADLREKLKRDEDAGGAGIASAVAVQGGRYRMGSYFSV